MVDYSEHISRVVTTLSREESLRGLFLQHLDGNPLPSTKAIKEIVELSREVIFPGYFGASKVNRNTVRFHMGVKVERLYELLTDQIAAALCFQSADNSAHARITASQEALHLKSIRRGARSRAKESSAVSKTATSDSAANAHAKNSAEAAAKSTATTTPADVTVSSVGGAAVAGSINKVVPAPSKNEPVSSLAQARSSYEKTSADLAPSTDGLTPTPTVKKAEAPSDFDLSSILGEEFENTPKPYHNSEPTIHCEGGCCRLVFGPEDENGNLTIAPGAHLDSLDDILGLGLSDSTKDATNDKAASAAPAPAAAPAATSTPTTAPAASDAAVAKTAKASATKTASNKAKPEGEVVNKGAVPISDKEGAPLVMTDSKENPEYAKTHEQGKQCLLCNDAMKELAADKAAVYISSLVKLRAKLALDVQAAFNADPAATSFGEVIACYPGVRAICNYRIAHQLLKQEVPLIPRAITELAHSETGIDIHPGARIGDSFSIDHGTGVVIGETCIIGKNVKLYQGVTLGAISIPKDSSGMPLNIPRHPILEDNVVVYSNATVLGRITIGEGAVIGGNVWVTENVAPGEKVVQQRN